MKKEMKVLRGTDRSDRQKNDLTSDHLKSVPKPKSYFRATTREREIFDTIAGELLKTERLRTIDLDALMLYAKEWETYLWADKAIQNKEKRRRGSGYIQTYGTGATNISPEMTIRERSFQRIIQLQREFGMTFKSRYTMPEMFGDKNPNQMNLLDQFAMLKNKAQ